MNFLPDPHGQGSFRPTFVKSFPPDARPAPAPAAIPLNEPDLEPRCTVGSGFTVAPFCGASDGALLGDGHATH